MEVGRMSNGRPKNEGTQKMKHIQIAASDWEWFDELTKDLNAEAMKRADKVEKWAAFRKLRQCWIDNHPRKKEVPNNVTTNA